MAGQGVRVLVVDDDPVLRRFVGSLLASNGFEVHEAEATPALVIPLAEYSSDAAFFGASSTSAFFSR